MEQGEGGRTGHSRMGVASFLIAILVVVATLALVVGAPLLLSQTDAIDLQNFDPANPQSIDLANPAIIALQVIGLSFIVSVLLSFVGFGLGIAGIVQRQRKRIFAVIGAISNGLVIAGVVVLILLAVAMGGAAA